MLEYCTTFVAYMSLFHTCNSAAFAFASSGVSFFFSSLLCEFTVTRFTVCTVDAQFLSLSPQDQRREQKHTAPDVRDRAGV